MSILDETCTPGPISWRQMAAVIAATLYQSGHNGVTHDLVSSTISFVGGYLCTDDDLGGQAMNEFVDEVNDQMERMAEMDDSEDDDEEEDDPKELERWRQIGSPIIGPSMD